jgi:hypothetical protein
VSGTGKTGQTRRGYRRRQRFEDAVKSVGEHRWLASNLRKGIARLENKLSRSMAYVADPRPRNFERWAMLAAEIAERKQALARLENGEAVAPPKVPRKGFGTEGKREC